MEQLKYDELFGNSEDLQTTFLTRPILQAVNTFGKSGILSIRDKHISSGFYNLLFDNDSNAVKPSVYLIYNSKYTLNDKPVLNWELFHDSVIKSKFFISEEQVNDETCAFRLHYPNKWVNDFNHIVNGKYSKVSAEYIRTFYPSKNDFLYHLKFRTDEVMNYYAELFKVDSKIFKDCEIGPLIDYEQNAFVRKGVIF